MGLSPETAVGCICQGKTRRKACLAAKETLLWGESTTARNVRREENPLVRTSETVRLGAWPIAEGLAEGKAAGWRSGDVRENEPRG